VTIQQDVLRARVSFGRSRKYLAEASGLTEGKIWRIEKKGNASADEAAGLQPVLDRIFANEALLDAPPVRRPAVPGPAATPASSSPAPPPPAAVGVDWPTLQAIAAEVGDHEIERITEGPDPTAGFRLYSNSELQAAADCPRRWWLGWYRGMRLKAESPVGVLAIGDRIHRALKLWYLPAPHPRVDPRTALEILITQDWTKITRQLGADSPELGAVQKRFQDEATLERAMIEGYVQWLTETGADSELEIIGAEQYVEVDLAQLEDTGIRRPSKLIAKYDVRARRKSDGVRLFIDHKTVGDLTRPRKTLHMNEQMLHYLFIEWLDTPEGEKRCDGALYNMLRKVRRSTAAKPPFYDRVEVHHNEIELQNYKLKLIGRIRRVEDMEDALDAGGVHQLVTPPRPTGDCAWRCEFFAVCPMFDDGSRAEDMLKMYYRESNPLEYYQTGLSEGELTGE
jgi:hypothetical protein